MEGVAGAYGRGVRAQTAVVQMGLQLRLQVRIYGGRCLSAHTASCAPHAGSLLAVHRDQDDQVLRGRGRPTADPGTAQR